MHCFYYEPASQTTRTSRQQTAQYGYEYEYTHTHTHTLTHVSIAWLWIVSTINELLPAQLQLISFLIRLFIHLISLRSHSHTHTHTHTQARELFFLSASFQLFAMQKKSHALLATRRRDCRLVISILIISFLYTFHYVSVCVCVCLHCLLLFIATHSQLAIAAAGAGATANAGKF